MIDPSPAGPPLRLAVFGESVVSDWHNPAATSWRALLRALTAAGHDAVFFEPRRNRPTVDLLRARGAGALRSFAARYPDVRYRTYDLPRGLERSVWFGREVSTLDAVVVLDTAPPELFEELRAYRTPRLVRLLHRTDAGPASPSDTEGAVDLVLSPTDAGGAAIAVGPAVEVPLVQAAPARTGVVVVGYDDDSTAEAAAAALAPVAPIRLTPGGLPAPWTFVPEVDLAEWYRAAEVAVVATAHRSPLAAARLALPLAAGCPVVVAGPDRIPLPPGLDVPRATPETVAAEVTRLRAAAEPPPAIPDTMRADSVAAQLVRLIHAELAALRRRHAAVQPATSTGQTPTLPVHNSQHASESREETR